MKNGKNILIFVLINVIAIVIAVILPASLALNSYKAYHYEIPKVGEKSLAENIGAVVKELETEEAKDALWAILEFGVTNRGEIFYDSFVWLYITLGIMLGISLIVIGIVLKYKSENKIYSKAFIAAGIIVVIAYIFILSILLQKNVFYAYF